VFAVPKIAELVCSQFDRAKIRLNTPFATFGDSDGNTANTDSISIYSKETPSNNSVMIATFYPYVVASARQFSGVLELSPFNAIAVRNNSSSSISGVSLKIFSA
jgi:hypothetical protein